ncbi:MAG TPA: glycosyltransferase family 4 protein [Bryobacteraceae bacterium]|nr:glycosyltransferase family 4 protein [Bryobacteraceae bacterium]
MTKVLVVFNTVCLYGMERSVIETFEVLRPEVEPLFLLNRANLRHRTPLLAAMKRSGMAFRFFSDRRDWPRFGRPRSLSQAWAILAALVQGNFDVWRAARQADALYLPIVTSAYISVLAALWFRLHGRKVIYFFHDLPPARSTKLCPAVALSTNLVHCAQRSLALAAAGNPFVLRRPNCVIPPAVRLRRSGTSAPPSGMARQNILFIGQVTPHKGVDLLIDAFDGLAARHQSLHLVIAGGVYDENRAWFDAVLDAAAQKDRIHFAGYCEGVHEFLDAAYVLAAPTLPSRVQESFGRVAAEAMAAGVPTVCFKSGALEELVVHGVTGLVCAEESAKCLAASLEEFLNRPDFRDSCGRNARRRYDERYSEDRVRRGWMRLLAAGVST